MGPIKSFAALQMFGTLKRWVGFEAPPDIGQELVKSRKELDAWRAWEITQPSSHFQRSAAYQRFVEAHPDFQGFEARNPEDDRAAIAYCFGDYQSFVPSRCIGSGTCERLLKSLIDLYDSGKGLVRTYMGDPPLIAALRLAQRDMSSVISSLGLTVVAYDYSLVHAHTVACYSLSTLILLLAANLVAMTNVHSRLPQIDVRTCDHCRRAGQFKNSGTAASAVVPIPGQVAAEGHYGSLPEGLPGKMCPVCGRATERAYGLFQACYDCHSCKICKLCGMAARRFGLDRLPRCESCP